MSARSSPEHRIEMLVQHLDGLFALAQVVTTDPDEAVRLVEAVFRRAVASDVEPDTPEEAKILLLRWLMQIRRERDDAVDDEAGLPHAELADFRRDLAERLVDRALPSAFAVLPAVERVLLMLCEVERLSCVDAARVLDIESDTACARLDTARERLHDAVRSAASETERQVLDHSLPHGWRSAALRRMIESSLTAAPPTLAPTLAVADPGTAPAHTTELSAAVPAESSAEPSEPAHLVRRLLAAVLVIAVAGLLGYGLSSLMQRQPNRNLISLSASQARGVEVSFQTASPEQAERYVFDRLGLRVTVPTITQAALEGVAIREVADGAEVPILLYRDASRRGLVVIYIYSYAFLDRHEKRLNIGNDILTQIEEEGNFDLHDLGQEKALIWRRRDDILVAITSDDAEELRRRITYPS